MSKLILFDKVGTQITDEVSSITNVQLWNNQLINENQEEARAYPICYLEIADIEWQDQPKGCQQGIVSLIVHVVIERYQTDDRTYLTLVDDVYKALQLFDADEFTPLRRVSEDQDTDHDNCIDWQIVFTTQLYDTTADQDADKGTVSSVGLDITTDLDIDDEVIRSGDGTF